MYSILYVPYLTIKYTVNLEDESWNADIYSYG